MGQDNALNTLLHMSDDELFIALGDQIAAKAKMGAGISDAQKASLARNWFSAQFETAKSRICGNKLLQDLSDKSDTTSLVSAIIPLLGLPLHLASTTIIGVLLARIGIRRMCSGEWTAGR